MSNDASKVRLFRQLRAAGFLSTLFILNGCTNLTSSNSNSNGPRTSEVTAYELSCANSDGAHVITTSTYRIDLEKQKVTRFTAALPQFNIQSTISELTACKIWSISDWECTSPDGHKLGFSGGIARSRAYSSLTFIGVDKKTWEQADATTGFAETICAKNSALIEALQFDARKAK